LITVNLSSAFFGDVTLSFEKTGVECRLVAPLQ
jgi:hypothetical protein